MLGFWEHPVNYNYREKTNNLSIRAGVEIWCFTNELNSFVGFKVSTKGGPHDLWMRVIFQTSYFLLRFFSASQIKFSIVPKRLFGAHSGFPRSLLIKSLMVFDSSARLRSIYIHTSIYSYVYLQWEPLYRSSKIVNVFSNESSMFDEIKDLRICQSW